MADGTLYVSNIAEGGVLRAKPGGPLVPWIKPGVLGSGTTYGVVADERSQTLWVCSNDLSKYGLAGSGDGRSAVLAFDLATGTGKYSIPFDGPAECNDIVVAPDGALYVTDSQASRVLRATPGGRRLEPFATDPRFEDKDGGLDGIALGRDGDLYVNTLGSGLLFRIALKDGKAGAITKIEPSRPLGATDGLRHERGDTFLTVSSNGQLERFTVAGDRATVEAVSQGLDEPTSLTIIGDIAYVTEGRLSYLFDKAKQGQAPPLPFHIRAVPLTSH